MARFDKDTVANLLAEHGAQGLLDLVAEAMSDSHDAIPGQPNLVRTALQPRPDHRERRILDVALSYALSNLDDLNEALYDDATGKILLGGTPGNDIQEDEIQTLAAKF